MSTDNHRAAYQAAHDAAGHLLAILAPLPTDLTIRCPAWKPDKPTIRVYIHRDLPVLETWAAVLGAELTVERHGGGQTYWSLTAQVDGIPVEAWTLLDTPDADE